MQKLNLLDLLKKQSDAVLIVNQFQEYLLMENQKRQAFYNDITPDIKAEFIGGEIILHSPVKRKHWLVSMRISAQMHLYVEANDLGNVGVEKVMIHLTRNSYEPDIVFFKKEVCSDFTDDQKLFPAPNLIVEILSESTKKNDYGIKFKDYAAHQVGEYWIVNPNEASLEQYILWEGSFELKQKFVKQGRLRSVEIEGFELDIKPIFL